MRQLVRALCLFLASAPALATGCADERDPDGQPRPEPDAGDAEDDAGSTKPTPIDGAARMAECMAEKSAGECYIDATLAFIEVTRTECGGPRGFLSEEDRTCLLETYADLDQAWVSCTALHEWLLAECASKAACDEARIHACYEADARYEHCDASKLGIKISEIYEICDSAE